MMLIFSLLFTLLLARTSSVREIREVDQHKHPALHLPLYHVQGRQDSDQTSETPLPFSEALALDRTRVMFLNSRLAKKNTTAADLGRLIDPKSVNVPLNPGVSLGIANYYTKVGLGTPPTYYPVVVDTGSSFSWIQCEPCKVYCHPQIGSYFNPSASRTYKQLSCDTRQCSALEVATLNDPGCTSSNVCIYISTYGDTSGSIGYLSRDSLSLGTGQALPNFVFGCGQDNEGLFGKSAGIFGLARNELSMFSQLSPKYGSLFSYCLPTNTPLGKIGSGGFLSFGKSSLSSFKFTPMLSEPQDPTLYFLKLSAISVAGRKLGVAASGYRVPTIIDSGTTISRLTASVYKVLRQELVRIISSKYQVTEAYSILDACFKGTSVEISKIVPKVQLIFNGGADLDLAPHNVILEVEKGTTCLAFAKNSDPSEVAIIGNQQQQTIEVVYDLSNSRIGFATGGCH
ncbi:aspartyl protease family protein At5g10770-like isoform X1 [Olea europaea var. sylvestris]|uniref:aspartyl protease family protein At5g10770-like isoform X1 n=1 Tax=Olea europaea var. sylvestris TaxID=158386 RepID=UPI000C1D4542|nr:aspartyl protease family protein At5g10770-like isoform X1 [Olea europaea var. sylvestris]